jgi:FixJ family two-component response regulator
MTKTTENRKIHADNPASQQDIEPCTASRWVRRGDVRSAEDFLAAGRDPETIGILLDLQLTGMSGLELQRRLNMAGSTLPVIVITGTEHPRLERLSRGLGCYAFLRKPCEAETILSVLRTLSTDQPPAPELWQSQS